MKWWKKKQKPVELRLNQQIIVEFCGIKYIGTLNEITTDFAPENGNISMVICGCLKAQ